MYKSKYFIAQDLYKRNVQPEGVKKTINDYLKEKVVGKPVGIDAREIFILAKVNLKLKDEKEAEKLFKICIQLDNKNVHARLELGKLYVKQGKEAEAERLFQECIRINSKNVHARLELGKLYASQEKEAEAERLFQEGIRIDPKNVHARLESGKLYASQGKEAEAERLFQEYMQLDPKNVHARLELGKLYVKQGKEAEAERLFQEGIRIDSKNVHERLELGKLYASQGKEAEAERLFKQIMQIDNKDIPARRELAILYNKQGKKEVAQKMFDEIRADEAQSTPQTTSIQTNPSPYILRKDGIADGLSCMVAQYFETLPQEEIKEAQERFLYLRNKNPEQVTMESNDLVWYLKFIYENITVMERFFKVKDNGEYVALQSRTLIVPNDVDIQDGKVTPEQKKLIETQNHTGNYIQTLEEKMKRVEAGYLSRNRDIEQ